MQSLRSRILQIMLLLLVTIVAVTLITVRTSSLKHSTEQVLGYAHTSAKVVEDAIRNQVSTIDTALQALTRDFQVKSLIFSSKNDQASAQSGLRNFIDRSEIDIIWVLDPEGRFITSTSDQMYDQFFVDAKEYQNSGIHL